MAQIAQAIAAALALALPPALANVQPQPGAGGGAGPPPFALHPALVNNQVLDYSTTTGNKLYNKATAPLPDEGNLTGETIQVFLTQLGGRAVTMGWSAICTIPDSNGNNRDLFTEFGMLNRQNMVDKANTYMGNDVRDKQNSAQMAVCIMALLDNEAQLTMRNAREDYVINDEPNGPLMLFEVNKRATINVHASTYYVPINWRGEFVTGKRIRH